MPRTKVDRTRIIQFQRCPRSRYENYHRNGIGIQPKRRNPAFLVGGYVHEGMDRLVLGNPLSMVLDDLRLEYDDEVAALSLDINDTDEQDKAKLESWWVIKACLCAFSVSGMPRLLDLYDVVETEHEEEVELTEDIDLMARTDALLRSRETTEDLYIGSWKTAKKWDARKHRDHAHDMQGVSEQFAIEPRVGRIMGVQMVHLIKGSREELKDADGNSLGWRVSNPLVYAYRRWNSDQNSYEWAHSYWYTCSEPHIKKVTKKGEEWCEGNKKHRLTDDYELVPIEETYDGGIEAWVYAIAAKQIQPNTVEAEQFIERFVIIQEPLFRHEWEKVKWHKQVSEQERKIKAALENEPIKETFPKSYDSWLDKNFPQYTHSCAYPSKCPFYEQCWGSIGEPLESGLYEPRKFNHPQEGKQGDDES